MHEWVDTWMTQEELSWPFEEGDDWARRRVNHGKWSLRNLIKVRVLIMASLDETIKAKLSYQKKNFKTFLLMDRCVCGSWVSSLIVGPQILREKEEYGLGEYLSLPRVLDDDVSPINCVHDK